MNLYFHLFQQKGSKYWKLVVTSDENFLQDIYSENSTITFLGKTQELILMFSTTEHQRGSDENTLSIGKRGVSNILEIARVQNSIEKLTTIVHPKGLIPTKNFRELF
ncbi:MAG: hypothetical protein AB1333_02645 [Patescibacteria group bacterium]